jgi:flavin-dependent dehydrogenase
MDVGIVGAGPAGSFCAERLAARGHAVTLYDPSHPREKPCGGGVTPAVFGAYPELEPLRAHSVATRCVRLRGPHDERVDVPLPRPIAVFPRRDLDAALLERALAQGAVLQGERVVRVAVDPGGARVATAAGERRHDFVVGADGPASVVRRSLYGERFRGAASWASGGYLVSDLQERDLYIEFLPDMPGYMWVFPRPDHVSAGVVAPLGRANGRRLRERVLDMLGRRYPGSLGLERRVFGASIPCALPGEAARPRLGGARFALVGDAAATADAITGEGIHYALDSGALLAAALDEAGPLAAARVYTERWRTGPGRQLLWAARIAHRAYAPRTVAWALRMARRSTRARRVMGDLLAVLQPYSDLPARLWAEALGSARPPRGAHDGSRGGI